MTINCQYWTATGSHGTCAIGKYGGRPSLGTCQIACLGLKMPDRGLGDTVARVIHAATLGTVTPCGGCQKRQEALNKLVPYHTDQEPANG